MKCAVCSNEKDNRAHKVKEMMFGFQEAFDYLECSRCGCLQLAGIPVDMSKYYPANYYSFNIPTDKRFRNPFTNYLKKLKVLNVVFGNNIIARFLYNKPPYTDHGPLKGLNLTLNSRIMDVGTGSGIYLYVLKNAGFKNLLGIEPYLENDITYKNGLKVLKRTVHGAKGTWDLVTFNHSFEHVPDPRETLLSVNKLLDKGGMCMLRVPVAGSFAWREYKANWAQIDAPRHFFLHTKKSISLLAEATGFIVEKTGYDSDEFQFWGSEQYLKGILFSSERSYAINPGKSIFTPKDIAGFRKKAKELNDKQDGDQAAFYLRKK